MSNVMTNLEIISNLRIFRLTMLITTGQSATKGFPRFPVLSQLAIKNREMTPVQWIQG